jgi:C4-dicarboxylate-specific signal transduction histidine kinase
MTKANLNWKTIAITLSAVAGILIIWLLVEDEKKRKKLIELQREIDENENFNIEVKKRLKELIQNNKEIDPKISNELGHIAALMEIQQETKALKHWQRLSKIY